MGFNTAGIVINENLENNIDEISKVINLPLEFEGEITFE